MAGCAVRTQVRAATVVPTSVRPVGRTVEVLVLNKEVYALRTPW